MKLTYPDHSVLTVRSTVSTSVLISSLKAMAVPISLRLWYAVLKVTSMFLKGLLPNVLATGLSNTLYVGKATLQTLILGSPWRISL